METTVHGAPAQFGSNEILLSFSGIEKEALRQDTVFSRPDLSLFYGTSFLLFRSRLSSMLSSFDWDQEWSSTLIHDNSIRAILYLTVVIHTVLFRDHKITLSQTHSQDNRSFRQYARCRCLPADLALAKSGKMFTREPFIQTRNSPESCRCPQYLHRPVPRIKCSLQVRTSCRSPRCAPVQLRYLTDLWLEFKACQRDCQRRQMHHVAWVYLLSCLQRLEEAMTCRLIR